MNVLIPHPTEYFKLIHFQKKVIKEFSNNKEIIYQKLPLWIPLPDSYQKQDLKSLSKSISDVKIDLISSFTLTLTVNDTDKQDFSLWNYLPLTDNKNIDTENLAIWEDFKKQNALDLFPMHLHIFRLGKDIQLNQNTRGLEESFWVKLKKNK